MNRQDISWKKENSGWFSKPGKRDSVSVFTFQNFLSRLTFGLVPTVKPTGRTISEPKIQAPARISLAYQFERAAQVVEEAVSRGDAIQALHKQTAQQLDATEYALHRLFDEIHSVLPRFEKPVYNNAVVRTAEAQAFRPTALAA